MKSKIKNKVTHVWSTFSTKETWFKIRTSEKDAFCKNCKTDLRIDKEQHIGLAFVENSMNCILCQDCCKHFILLGAIDRDAKVKELNETKESLIEQIGNYNFSNLFWRKKLSELNIEELKEVLEAKLAYDGKEKLIQEDILNYVDEPTEQYLKDEYNLIEDKGWLKTHLLLNDYFLENGNVYFECGQGYYNDEVNLYVKIGNKYYDVTVTAEINSAKQDYGDRLYWVESIKSVTWKEISKPLPKTKIEYTYKLLMTDYQKQELENCIRDLKIKILIET